LEYEKEIEELRKKNDRLNSEIVEKLSEWLKFFTEIKDLNINYEKHEFSRKISEETRNVTQKLAKEHHLDKQGINRIFNEILKLQRFSEESAHINF
jgi:chorismate mutase